MEKIKKVERHKICPFCGSKNIEEIKPKWGICNNCEGNFHMIPLPYPDPHAEMYMKKNSPKFAF